VQAVSCLAPDVGYPLLTGRYLSEAQAIRLAWRPKSRLTRCGLDAELGGN
jgi:hypothetical protein